MTREEKPRVPREPGEDRGGCLGCPAAGGRDAAGRGQAAREFRGGALTARGEIRRHAQRETRLRLT